MRLAPLLLLLAALALALGCPPQRRGSSGGDDDDASGDDDDLGDDDDGDDDDDLDDDDATGPDADGDGWTVAEGDCDDSNPDVYPGRPEICDGMDNDCNGEVDNGFDADDDGWTSCAGDCANGDPLINPDAQEACDGVDNNCDGHIDEEFDLDGDGYVGYQGAWYATCADLYAPGGEYDELGDCNDDSSAGGADMYPAAHEDSGNGVDDDCDGCVDECQDADGDGWDTCDPGDSGDPSCAVSGENGPDDGLVADCDDCTHPDCFWALQVHPDAVFEVVTSDGVITMDELCDNVDNDCDGQIDEGYHPKTCQPL